MPTMSPEAQDLLNLLPNLFQPNGSTMLRRNALADQALAQAADNVAMTPELGTAEFQALQNALMAPPQSVLTQDREYRHFGAEPTPPPVGADTFANEMNVAIPNLMAKGYQNIGPARPPDGISSIGTPEGYMAASGHQQPGRDVNELMMLDNQNKATQGSGGMLGMLQSALMGPSAAPNQLSQKEQRMVDALKADEAKRDATMAERQKLVTQNAQMKQAARNFRQEGPDAMMFAQLTQALQGGGQGAAMGPPDQRLALLAPKVYAAQLEAWEAAQNQQRLDLADKRLNQRDIEEGRRFDIQTGLTREGMAQSAAQHREEMDLNRQKLDPYGLNDGTTPSTTPAATADQQARRNARDTALGVNVVERDKNAGVYTEEVRKELEAQYKATKRRDFNPMTMLSPDSQHFDNQHFIQEMTKQGWKPDVIQKFLSETGRAVPAPSYPTPPTFAERQATSGGGSWLFPGF